MKNKRGKFSAAEGLQGDSSGWSLSEKLVFVQAVHKGFSFYIAETFVDILYDTRLYGNIHMYAEKILFLKQRGFC
jgi:hypothetical protein